jgi:serine/threonine protein kinase
LLGDPDGRVEFARQLYNLLHLEVEDKENRDTRAKIDQLKHKIELNVKKFNLKSFYHTQGTKKKCVRTDDVDSASDGGDDTDTADCAELGAHDYKVEPQVIVDESGGTWEPLFEVWPGNPCLLIIALTPRPQMPSHIHTVYRRSEPKTELIAKKVRKGSNELAILKRLNTIQPRSENIVSLLDSFDGLSGSWAILPKLGSVAHYIVVAPAALQNKVPQVCWGLIKGLAYLHGLRIAHRDIKPDNLLVDKDFCLKIIDFDIAMQVKDEDEEVDDECGTKHWTAPEVENNSSTYSPIKADRWSCGHVLLYLLDKLRTDDGRLRAIGRKLEVRDPKQRPSLLEWHNWLPVPLLDMCDIRNVGARKASRPRQDSVEVDGERTTAPNAKKQRLSTT